MKCQRLNRRDFVKTTCAAAATGAARNLALSSAATREKVNTIPRWKGFNLLDYFSPNPRNNYAKTNEMDLKWMADWGFDFVRIPMAYPRYVKFDRSRNITPEEICNIDRRQVDKVEELVETANKFGLHVSLNLHRAPGYCVNAGFHEPYNLWKDDEAVEAFCFHWGMWAERFQDLPPEKISFDLINEPSTREDMNDQHSRRSPVPGQVYRRLASAAAESIRKHNPDHLVIADGNDVGNTVIPEIVDLKIAQSCRGYYPHYISHFRAPWVFKTPDDAPEPVWPGTIDGKEFGRGSLEAYYRPWIELAEQGVGVHCGECGCWNQTPHEVFLAWFGDILDILTPHGIGYALWNFRGSFGVLDSERPDVKYEDWYGRKLDRKLLDLLSKY
ncbi:MAG TPA: cellulase family glycosylhydrolase [Acidobacteriota bacterium]|nr:cellulase family glycosylhydrolase [Acidobacteriota bacterium]